MRTPDDDRAEGPRRRATTTEGWHLTPDEGRRDDRRTWSVQSHTPSPIPGAEAQAHSHKSHAATQRALADTQPGLDTHTARLPTHPSVWDPHLCRRPSPSGLAPWLPAISRLASHWRPARLRRLRRQSKPGPSVILRAPAADPDLPRRHVIALLHGDVMDGSQGHARSTRAAAGWRAALPACACATASLASSPHPLDWELSSPARNAMAGGVENEGSAWRVGDRGRQRASEGGSGDNGMHGWPGLLGPPSIACGRCSLSAFEDIDWGQHRRIPSFLTFDPFHPIHSTPFPQLIPSETYPEPKDHIPLIPASYTPHTDPNFTRSHTAPPRRRP